MHAEYLASLMFLKAGAAKATSITGSGHVGFSINRASSVSFLWNGHLHSFV